MNSVFANSCCLLAKASDETLIFCRFFLIRSTNRLSANYHACFSMKYVHLNHNFYPSFPVFVFKVVIYSVDSTSSIRYRLYGIDIQFQNSGRKRQKCNKNTFWSFFSKFFYYSLTFFAFFNCRYSFYYMFNCKSRYSL